MTPFQLLTSIGLLTLILRLYLARSWTRTLPLPPGPKKLPLFEWESYQNWCKEYNTDIIHLNVAGTSIIVLDTAEAANELLEKRSSIYSGRPRMPMINELMGWDYNFGFMAYGEKWRQRRKLMHQMFQPAAATRFRPHELKATHELLRRFLDKPQGFMDHIRHSTAETILSVAYGIEVLPYNDPYIDVAERGGHALVIASVPGAFLVDSIPLLKHVPAWMPFAGFQRKAREWRKLALAMAEMPFEAAKRNIASGNTMPSFTSYCLQNVDGDEDIIEQETVIQSAAGTMYAAGSDITVAAITSCILGFLVHPEVQKKAQQEVDSVLQHSELPDFSDEESLPYVTAIVKETLRWKTVAPIGIPHFLSVDDEYNGYRLPAGSVVIANSWAILHDENVYPDPYVFNPDRFMKDGKLNPEVRDPLDPSFGFGRRVCPARHMAFSSVWIAIANILATFDITKAVDEDGNVIEPSQKYLSALVYHPFPFACNIKPRSEEAEKLIRATVNTEYAFEGLSRTS